MGKADFEKMLKIYKKYAGPSVDVIVKRDEKGKIISQTVRFY